jgi:hypothetical protein
MIMTGKPKAARDVFRVMRSHDALNEGDLIEATEDDWIKGRVSAGLFRKQTPEEVEEQKARGQVVMTMPDVEEASSAATVQGSDATQP